MIFRLTRPPVHPVRPIKLGPSGLERKGYHWTPGGTLWLLSRLVALEVPKTYLPRIARHFISLASLGRR